MQRKKYEIEILRLKIVLQDLFDAKVQHDTGTADLALVLKEFRTRIDNSSLEAFDKNFFGHSMSQDNTASNTSLPESTDITVSDMSPSDINQKKPPNVKLPSWAKKIYKTVVQRTHPDRFIDFPVQDIKDKFTKIYIDAVSAYEKGDLGVLLLCAYEAEVRYEHIEEALVYIQTSYNSAIADIEKTKKYLGYQWFHLDNEKKLVALENYLRQQGFVFEKEKAEKIIRGVSKRKVGKKPMKKIRVKIEKKN